MKIWCLFSVENNYDQPENNLVSWWTKKPDFDTLAKAMGFGGFPCSDNNLTIYVANMWQGTGGGQYSKGSTSYRLEEIEEGAILESNIYG